MHLIMDGSPKGIRASVLEHLDTLAAYTGADIFLLNHDQNPGFGMFRALQITVNGNPEALVQAIIRRVARHFPADPQAP
jgi:hypothetical protein